VQDFVWQVKFASKEARRVIQARCGALAYSATGASRQQLSLSFSMVLSACSKTDARRQL
jgi:hypothetical protein